MDEIKKQDRSPYFACFVNKHNEAFEISARRLIMERIKNAKRHHEVSGTLALPL